MSLLTSRQREILIQMRDAEESYYGELVYEHGCAYLGWTRVAPRTVFALLRLCAISADPYSSGAFGRYHINDTGRSLIAS